MWEVGRGEGASDWDKGHQNGGLYPTRRAMFTSCAIGQMNNTIHSMCAKPKQPGSIRQRGNTDLIWVLVTSSHLALSKPRQIGRQCGWISQRAHTALTNFHKKLRG